MDAIDAVITWVDGKDPAHARKRAQLLGATAASHAAADATRFGDCGEIAWCVASLLRFAPWLRCIHIVADEQVPAFVQRIAGSPLAARVRMASHRELFEGHEDVLPTFSSRTIETMVHRVPGLSERFLYLNDDFMVVREVSPADFFGEDGVVLRGDWRRGGARDRGERWRAALRNLFHLGGAAPRVARPGHHAAQQASGRLAGFSDRYFQSPHCASPLRCATIERWQAAHPGLVRRQIGFRLRDAGQFLPVALANHLELAAGTARVDNRLGTLRLRPSRQSLASLRADCARADADPSLAFACVQSLDEASPPARAFVEEWLRRRIGPPL